MIKLFINSTRHIFFTSHCLTTLIIAMTHNNADWQTRMSHNENAILKDIALQEISIRSGRSGYIVVTTPFDNFPHTWVIVHFWEEK